MSKYGKIYPVSFGFGWGVMAGLGWMLLCWAGARYGFGLPVISLMSNVYEHLAPTFVGGLWGFFWGFVDFFIFSMFAAMIYNCSCSCFCPKGECDTSCDK
ncbi:MAG: hypothetical protein NTU49_09830 [Gammaproteobacteria bacterium]|nr:hypothetical protein [Gammaproteobacteria bacterium]